MNTREIQYRPMIGVGWCLLVCLWMPGNVAARDEWQLDVEGPLCRDAFAVSADGRFVVFLEKSAVQPPERKGPPPPPNATIWVQELATGMVTKLGGRDTLQKAYPYFCYPGPAGHYFAALVHRLATPSDPTSDNDRSVYMIDLPNGTSQEIATSISQLTWNATRGTLLVSTVGENQATQPIRQYDPQAGQWTTLPIHGTCWAMAADGTTGICAVVPQSLNESTSFFDEVTPHLALVTTAGQFVRDLEYVGEWVGQPQLSANGKFLAVQRLSLRGPRPLPSVVVVPLQADNDVLVEHHGDYTLVGVTNEGGPVVIATAQDVSGRSLLKLLGQQGSSRTLSENVQVAAVRGNDVYWVVDQRPAVLYRVDVSSTDSTGASPEGPAGPNLLGQSRDSMEPSDSGEPRPGPDSSSPPSAEAYRYSVQQEQVRDRLGDPQAFTIRFINERAGPVEVQARSEQWTYFAARTQFEFLDGECIKVRELPRADYPRSVTVDLPWQFVAGMTIEEARERLQLGELKPLDWQLEAGLQLELKKLSLWTNGSLLLGFADDRLVLVQSMPRILPQP